MTYKLTHSLLIIFKPLCGFILALGLIGCSNSKTDSAHHTDHAHGEEHADGTLTHSETATNSATDTHNDDHNDEAHSTIRSAESHVHGGAILSIVSERNKIAIEFETPIYNLLGFEYAPQTPAEKARVQDVEKTLAAPASLIRFNKEAKCDYAAPDSQIKLFDEHADDPEHDEEHHDEEHHDDDNDDTHEKAGSHKDLIVTYELTCKDIDKLKSVQVEFFSVFSNFTELELVYLGPSKQKSAKLSSSRPNVDLTR